MPSSLSRRNFLKTSAAGLAVTGLAPAVVTADKTQDHPRIGNSDYAFEVEHDFLQLPSDLTWQTTHNVAVDDEGLIYVIHEGNSKFADHPSIFVFAADGKYVRSFGAEFQGGGHGLEVRTEGNEQYLYVTAYQHLKQIAKLTLTGENVWTRRAPMESDRYAAGEASDPGADWGRDRFMPTNIAFLEDGGFLVADGYGAYCIHRYDSEAQWVSTFGGPGDGDGQFSLPHGIWIDDRGEHPNIVIADRQNNRLQWFTLEGDPIKTMGDFLLPANVDRYGDLLLVPELQARITLLGPNDEVLIRLGDDADWRAKVLANNMQLRSQPAKWESGRFVHPHDACFDKEGNILVAEWVATGRVSRLNRLG